MTKVQYGHFREEFDDSPLPVRSQLASRLAAIRGMLLGNRELLRNAGSLAATTGVTSIFGFAYWIYAARVFPQAAVGYGSAAISTMNLLGTVGMYGIGTMLIGELPRRKSRGGLMMAGLIASFVGSLALGVVFAVASLAFGNHFVEISGTVGRMALFALGVAVTGATLVFDDATIGLMRGGLQLTRNAVVAIAKMAILPACGLVLHDVFGVGIMLSWLIGTIVSLIPVMIMVKRAGSSVFYRPDWESFWRLGKVTLAHNWLNLAINAPVKLVPVLVVVVVSPSSNAAYYVATMLASFLFMVPMHLSTVLFAIASAAPQMLPEKLRFVLRTSLVIGIPGGLILGVSSHYVLSVFGSSYASLATGPLWLLIANYLPGLPNTVYIDVCRATGRVTQATTFLSAAAAIEMVAVFVGGKLGGLYGLSYGLLVVTILEALITTPTVLRAALGRMPMPVRATVAATAQQPQLATQAADDVLRRRQEEGLAALIAIASSASSGQSRPEEEEQPASTASRVPAWLKVTRMQPSVGAGDARHRRPAVAATRVNRAITGSWRALNETNWWPDADEETFHERQEAAMAALIAMATHAARM